LVHKQGIYKQKRYSNVPLSFRGRSAKIIDRIQKSFMQILCKSFKCGLIWFINKEFISKNAIATSL